MKKFILIFTAFILYSCDFPRCGPSSKVVSNAKNLPQKRLSKLYADMKWHYENKTTGLDSFFSNAKPLPKEFADFEFARIRPSQADIMLEGCYDEYVYLYFDGLNDNKSPAIYLIYPTHSDKPYETKSELLWKKNNI